MNTEKQIDILLQTIDRHWTQAIQLENQRANFTNYILIIIGATQGYIIQRQFDKFSIILSIIISVLGVFGLIVSLKYYERFREQTTRVGRLIERLGRIEGSIDLDDLEGIAKEKHKVNFPRLIKMRLHNLWTVFHSSFIILGIIDFLIIYFDWYSKIR